MKCSNCCPSCVRPSPTLPTPVRQALTSARCCMCVCVCVCVYLLFFFKLYVTDYAITIVPIFPPFHPSTQQPPVPQAILTSLLMSMGHAYKFFGYSTTIVYNISPCPHGYSVTIYLYFLIPSPFCPFPHTTLLSGNHQNALHIHDSSLFFLLLCCFFRFHC